MNKKKWTKIVRSVSLHKGQWDALKLSISFLFPNLVEKKNAKNFFLNILLFTKEIFVLQKEQTPHSPFLKILLKN